VSLDDYTIGAEGPLELGPLELRDIEATLAGGALGRREGEEVSFNAGELIFRVTATASLPKAKGLAPFPVDFYIKNTSLARARENGVGFAFEDLTFAENGMSGSVRVWPGSCTSRD